MRTLACQRQRVIPKAFVVSCNGKFGTGNYDEALLILCYNRLTTIFYGVYYDEWTITYGTMQQYNTTAFRYERSPKQVWDDEDTKFMTKNPKQKLW